MSWKKKLEIVIGAASARGVYSTHRQQRTNERQKEKAERFQTDRSLGTDNVAFKSHFQTRHTSTTPIYLLLLQLVLDTYI